MTKLDTTDLSLLMSVLLRMRKNGWAALVFLGEMQEDGATVENGEAIVFTNAGCSTENCGHEEEHRQNHLEILRTAIDNLPVMLEQAKSNPSSLVNIPGSVPPLKKN